MSLQDKANAILSLVPNAEFAIVDNVLIWHKPSIAPVTEAEINAEIARLKADYESKQYQRDRASAYKPLTEQLDMMYWDRVNGTSTWKEHIDAVKAAHPKGDE